MIQIIQSYKTGGFGLFEVPTPTCKENDILAQTRVNLVSSGTEKCLLDFAKKFLLPKVKDKPDIVKEVIDKIKKSKYVMTYLHARDIDPE